MKNIRLKLFSLVFAVILWIFATTGKKAEIGIIAPVELKNIPKDMVVVDLKPPSVDVRIYGPKSLLRNILDKDIKVTLNLANLSRPGLVRYRITGYELELPRGVVLRNVEPKSVEIVLDRLVEKRVRVEPRYRGKPKDMYKVSGVSAEPSYVEVRGPEKELRRIKFVSTEPVNIEGKSESFSERKKVIFPKLYHVSVRPDEVEVKVSIRPREGEKELKVKLNPPKGYRLSHSFLKVRLKGPLPLLQELSTDSVEVDLGIDGSKKRGVAEPRVSVDAEGVSVVSFYPRRIKYYRVGDRHG